MTVADNADGTGSVATITDSSGASNSVYYSLFSGGTDVGSYAWTLGGTRTGDGTVAMAITTLGYYQYMLVAGSFSPTNSVVVYGRVSNAALAEAHEQFLDGTINRINQLSLVPTTSVLKRWFVRAQDPEIQAMIAGQITAPIITVSPNGQEEYAGMVTGEDDVILPAQVSIVYPGNADTVAKLTEALSFRNRIARAMRYQRLIGLTGEAAKQLTVVPKPGQIVDPDIFNGQNLLAGHYYFGLHVRQTRGLT
jgi:hypothetical protein